MEQKTRLLAERLNGQTRRSSGKKRNQLSMAFMVLSLLFSVIVVASFPPGAEAQSQGTCTTSGFSTRAAAQQNFEAQCGRRFDSNLGDVCYKIAAWPSTLPNVWICKGGQGLAPSGTASVDALIREFKAGHCTNLVPQRLETARRWFENSCERDFSYRTECDFFEQGTYTYPGWICREPGPQIH